MGPIPLRRAHCDLPARAAPTLLGEPPSWEPRMGTAGWQGAEMARGPGQQLLYVS